MSARTGGQLLVDRLVAHGVDTIFCVPGESYLAALDALHDAPITLITTRHEAGAATMAEAYGKLTGRPGVCFVTRGPGATHASVGVHTARQDSTPMVLLVGQVEYVHRGREAFQEVDFEEMFRPLAKWVGEAAAAAHVPRLLDEAFVAASSGRRGPAVVSLPEDVLYATTQAEPGSLPVWPGPAAPSAEDLAATRSLLAAASRPLVLIGGGGWTEEAGRDVIAWAEANRVPLITSFRRQDYVGNTSRAYCGYAGVGVDPAVASRLRGADWLLALGARLDDPTTSGYTLVEAPEPSQTLVHVHSDPAELGRVFRVDVGIVSDSPEFTRALAKLEPVESSGWAQWADEARKDWLAGLTTPPAPGRVDLGVVVRWLADRLPDDSVIANGAGNFAIWPNRLYTFRRFRTQLAPTSGAMGYGLPAALAAKLVRPESVVVCFAGDGDFLMSGQELATAMRYGLPVVVLVINNGMLGTIRMHQERAYPGRVVGTDLTNPDFAAYAHAFGARGEAIESTDQFEPAFERALAADVPTVLDLRVDPEALTLRQSLSAVREAAQAGAGR